MWVVRVPFCLVKFGRGERGIVGGVVGGDGGFLLGRNVCVSYRGV